MSLLDQPTLNDLREIMYDINYDDLALWGKFDLDFMREFQDRINWREVFKKMYLNSRLDLAKYNFYIDEFDKFCKNYNEKFFKEYFERYYD